MISFKQFLVESQNYPLYHGAPLWRIAKIITDNKITAYGEDAHHLHKQLYYNNTISFTRSEKFASYWAERSARLYDLDGDGKSYGVIKLNRAKLRNRYKIYPYNHFYDRARDLGSRSIHHYTKSNKLDKNQYEERVVGDIKNVSDYIDKITVNNIKDFEEKFPKAYEIAKSKNWL